MIGDTITLTINSVEKVLTKVQESGYSSEYLLKESGALLRLQVRHQNESPQNGVAYERHNIVFTRTVYGTGDDPDTFDSYSATLRLPSRDAITQVRYDGLAVMAWLDSTVLGKVLGWES